MVILYYYTYTAVLSLRTFVSQHLNPVGEKHGDPILLHLHRSISRDFYLYYQKMFYYVDPLLHQKLEEVASSSITPLVHWNWRKLFIEIFF
jgi:hypothetical protein